MNCPVNDPVKLPVFICAEDDTVPVGRTTFIEAVPVLFVAVMNDSKFRRVVLNAPAPLSSTVIVLPVEGGS